MSLSALISRRLKKKKKKQHLKTSLQYQAECVLLDGKNSQPEALSVT